MYACDFLPRLLFYLSGMKYITFLFIFLGLLTFTKTTAQTIDYEAIQKIQDGQVSFLEGEFVVFLKDTVSPSFLTERFNGFGYTISFQDMHSILISLVNSPSDSVLTKLQNHPSVSTFYSESAPIDSAYFQRMLNDQGISGEKLNKTFERLVASQTQPALFFEFNYSVNEMGLNKIMSNFRSVAYQIVRNIPRSVNVSCYPGKEQELMEQIESLPFVESTALIGVIGN